MGENFLKLSPGKGSPSERTSQADRPLSLLLLLLFLFPLLFPLLLLFLISKRFPSGFRKG